MADKKISQLSDGTSFQAGDEAVVNRSGTNYKVDPTQFGSSIDVTGTVTATGLAVNAGGSAQISLNADNAIGNSWVVKSNTGSGYPLTFNVSGGGYAGTKFKVDRECNVSFFENTGTTPKFFWDASAESLGIGTSSPGNTLEIIGPSSTGASSTGNALLIDGPSSTNGMKFFVDDSANACGVQTRSLDDFLINPAGGNVGIGTSSPSGKLHISGTGTTYFFADGTQTSDGEIFDLVVRNGTDTVTSIKSIRTGTDDAAALTFSTQPTFGGINERMRITSTGNVGIGTSSPGQKLEVNGNIIADGIYLGGTGAANLLEDYEEGTWTPEYAPETGAFTSVTYQEQAGSYTKIGNRVFFQGRIRTTSITVGTASGDVRISGLPFTAINDAATGRNAGSISACAGFGGDMPSGLDVEPNTTFFNLRYRTSANGATSDLDVSDLGTGSNSNLIFFSGSYTV